MQKIFFTFFFLCMLVAAGIVVAFEYYPESSATRFIEPYCRSRYIAAREKVLDAVARIRSKVHSSGSAYTEKGAPAKPAAAGREEATSREVSSVRRKDLPATQAADETVKKTSEKPTFEDAKWYSRKKVREGDFKGKVVIGCVWNVKDRLSRDLLKNAQRIADGFRGKPLVVFSSHRGGASPAVGKFLRKESVTIPCCEGAGHPEEPRSAAKGPVYYMFDKNGKLRYFGKNDKSMIVKLVDLLSM